MQALRRDASVSSTDSSLSSASSINTSLSSENSRPRRRPSPPQLQALQAMFKLKSHPTRQDRVALAAEIGMEFNSVTTWFQNKRSATKRQALLWKNPISKTKHRLPSSTTSRPALSTSALGTTISLDKIAAISERPTLPASKFTPTIPRTPLTPRHNLNNSRQWSDGARIWERMLSSPTTAPPSPKVDRVRFSVLPGRCKSWRSLEWACAKARSATATKENDIDTLPVFGPIQRRIEDIAEEAGAETETEFDEAAVFSAPSKDRYNKSAAVADSHKRVIKKDSPVNLEMEAALVLLDFTTRR